MAQTQWCYRKIKEGVNAVGKALVTKGNSILLHEDWAELGGRPGRKIIAIKGSRSRERRGGLARKGQKNSAYFPKGTPTSR